MAATQLSIYRGACKALGERLVASLAENTPARIELDDVWDRDGLKTCLSAALWNHAMRTQRLDYSPSIAPTFGYRRAFYIPDDFCGLANICSDEHFRAPLTAYQEEAGYWFTDLETIFVRYVSSDPEYGLDFSRWPANFTRYVEHEFAVAVHGRIKGSSGRSKQEVLADREFWLDRAKSKDAAGEAAKKMPTGSWSSSRRAGSRSHRDN